MSVNIVCLSCFLLFLFLFLLVSFSFVGEWTSKEDKNSSFSSSSFVDHCKENFGFFQTPECFFRFPPPFLLHPPSSTAITHCVSRFKSLPLHEFFIFPNLCAHCRVIPTAVRVFFFLWKRDIEGKKKERKKGKGWMFSKFLSIWYRIERENSIIEFNAMMKPLVSLMDLRVCV